VTTESLSCELVSPLGFDSPPGGMRRNYNNASPDSGWLD
jgi:hypothetical protein